jgi:hypothetical protein
METKICNVCGDEKPLSAFNKARTGKHGRHKTCRQCDKDRHTRERLEDKEIEEKGLKKKCSECGKSKLLTMFYRDRRREDGRQAQCKACRKKNYGGDQLFSNWPICKYCGDDLTPEDGKECCTVCASKAIKWSSGSRYVYLCTQDPGPHAAFKGGHFFNDEMQEMLSKGYWYEGTEFELWKNGKYKTYYRVDGAQLEPQELIEVEGVEGKGDGRFLRVV